MRVGEAWKAKAHKHHIGYSRNLLLNTIACEAGSFREVEIGELGDRSAAASRVMRALPARRIAAPAVILLHERIPASQCERKKGRNPGRPRASLRYEARRSSRMTASAIPGTASWLDGSPVRSLDQRRTPSSPDAPASRSSTSKAPERGAPSGFPTNRNAPGKACSTRRCSSSNRGS